MSNAFIDDLGATLARAREDLGITQVEAANRLKLTPRQIEAIEAEDWAHLPGEVFLRGFVRNYARVLNLRPEDLIRPVDRDATTTHTITAPSEGLRIGRSPITRWVALPLAVLSLFLLVVALLYQWLSQGEQALVAPQSGAVATPAASAPVKSVPGSAAIPSTPQAPSDAPGQTVVQPVTLDPQPLQATQPPQPPAKEPAMPAPAAPARELPPPAGEAAAPDNPGAAQDTSRAGATLRFMPGDDAWIQVVDGQGQRFSKLVRAGVPEQLSGHPPFKLVVGNAAQVKVTYNGHHIDLAPFIGEKVARLTLE
jgi:cytoskeleton protein RodZ